MDMKDNKVDFYLPPLLTFQIYVFLYVIRFNKEGALIMSVN